MSYRYVNANDVVNIVDIETQNKINEMDCVYIDGIKPQNQHFNLADHDKQIENNAYQQGKKDKEKELKEHNVFVSNIAIEDIVLDARNDERKRIIAELEEKKHKVYSTYSLSENNIDLGITFGLENAIKLVRGEWYEGKRFNRKA